MKKKVSSIVLAGFLVVVLVLLNSMPVWAVTYDGVEFPLGDISFADRVVSFIPGNDTSSPYDDPQTTIGPPDYESTGDGSHVALGHGGILTVKFTNNYLIDVDGPDLYVFEIGPAVEAFNVEISKDGSSWIDLGTVSGQPTSLDIHDHVNLGDKFSYVKVTDGDTHRSSSPYAGADIDAVGAIGAEEREEEECVDAELVVQVGDIDNLGFGWPTGFDVYSGNSTPSHSYPWTPEADDPPGTDMIMLGTSYDGNPPAGRDGYTTSTSRPDNLPQSIELSYSLGGLQVNSAILQMFVDDFQAPVWRSQFQAQLNGQRATFLEDTLNALSQTGPIGKLISVQIPSNFLSQISSGKLSIYIDDPTTGAGDGFAIDFVRLLVNPCLSDYVGTITGIITDATTGQSLQGVTVSTAGTAETTTGSNGSYVLSNVPAGLAVVTASSSGYESQTLSVDLVADTSSPLDFTLTPGEATPEPTSTTPGPIVPETGLVAYYPFNGDTQDYSGSGNHATNEGATFTTGLDGQALDFDGSDDYVYSPVNINTNVMPQVTMIAWVKSDTDNQGTVISHDNGGYDRSIDIDERGGGEGWSAFAGSGGVLGYHPVSVNNWTFLAVSYDQDAEIVRLYVNNEVYEKSGSLGSGWDYLHIGANPSYGVSFSGVIDEVRIYNYALSGSQIGTIRDEGGTPSTPGTPTTPVPGGPTLTFESRSKSKGSTVQIPLTLSGVQEKVGNMDITLSYDSSVLEAVEGVKGGLTGNSIFDYNIQNGTILISLADNQGFSGNGSVANVRFNVIGAEGSTSPLDIVDLIANRASDMASMNITAVDGIFRVLSLGSDEAIADCNGDGKLSVLDALCALQMAVGKRAEDPAMDINNDGQITSLDARRILRIALGLETL